MKTFRKKLSAPGLLETARKSFDKIVDKKRRASKIRVADCLMSGIAIFSLKYASLLQFEKDGKNEHRKNLKNLYGIKQVPSDTYLREALNRINPEVVRSAFACLCNSGRLRG